MKTEFNTKEYRTLITADRLEGLLRCASMVPIGTWAECGVYKGGSLRCLADHFPGQQIIGFDTFEGLPKEQWQKGEVHEPGDFSDTSFQELNAYLFDCENINLCKGVFPKTAHPFAGHKFSFVHVDFDFEIGIRAAIEFFWPRMVEGGIIVFDDYEWNNCPGVKKALSGYKVIPTANYQVALIK